MSENGLRLITLASVKTTFWYFQRSSYVSLCFPWETVYDLHKLKFFFFLSDPYDTRRHPEQQVRFDLPCHCDHSSSISFDLVVWNLQNVTQMTKAFRWHHNYVLRGFSVFARRLKYMHKFRKSILYQIRDYKWPFDQKGFLIPLKYWPEATVDRSNHDRLCKTERWRRFFWDHGRFCTIERWRQFFWDFQ